MSRSVAVIALVAVLVAGVRARACGPEMPVPTLADHAAQVVVAEVVSVRSYWASDPRRIETELVLGDVEYLKGGYDGAPRTITLTVPGGRVGDWEMRLCCAPQYRPGERWTLFLLPTCKVHPVVGMDRGSFRVLRDAQGVERVYGADGRAVAGIDPTGALAFGAPGEGQEEPTTKITGASGVRVAERGAAPDAADASAMTLEAFRAGVAPALARSKDYGLRTPAGVRVPADHRAVPIKEAGANAPAVGGADE